MSFGSDTFPVEVPAHHLASFDIAWDWLGAAGGAWTAVEKGAMVDVARAAERRPLWDRRPATIDHLAGEPGDGAVLSPLTIDTVERVTAEADEITAGWARAVIDRLGDTAYAELVAVCAIVSTIDRACRLLGRPIEPAPSPTPGEPTGERAEATIDIGAFLPVAEGFPGANIARSLSVAPSANIARLQVVRALYSGTRFDNLRWDDGALNRPQIELIAARTSALNQCFY